MMKTPVPFRKALQCIALAVLTGATLTACDAMQQHYPAQSVVQTPYHLGNGDIIRLKILGDGSLDGEYRVDSDGAISIPLIGSFEVSSLTIRGVEKKLHDLLDERYLRNPVVSAEIINYRDIYIIGEVNQPGNYAYVPGMTGLQAVALAGGYKVAAAQDEIEVRRQAKSQVRSISLSATNAIKPGDTLIIKRRWF